MSVIEKNFDRAELVKLVAAKTGETAEVVAKVIDAALGTLKTKVCELGYAELHKFGSFKVKTKAPRKGVTPKGKSFDVGKRVSIDFNPDKYFREELEQLTGTPAIS